MNQEEMIRDVRKRLFEMQDTGYRDFHARLIPTVEKEKIIGIRTPILRKFAKEFGKTEESELFLKVLPHQYYEENNLHGPLPQKWQPASGLHTGSPPGKYRKMYPG